MSFRIDDEKLLEKCKAIWTKIKDLKKYWIKYFTFLWEYEIEYFTVISIDSLLVSENK